MKGRRDRVSWVKLDDQFHSHPKVIAGGNEVAGVYARSLAYCGAYHTDGFVSRRQAAMFAMTRVLKRVTEAGLWEEVEPGQTRVVTDRRDSGNRPLENVTVTFSHYGFFIEDFLHHNPTREEAEAARAKRRSAGSKGGQANAQASAEAGAQAFASQEAAQSASTLPSRPGLEKSISTPLPGERSDILDDFRDWAEKIELGEWDRFQALKLEPRFLDEAMRKVRSRQDVGSPRKYFARCVANLHEAQKAWRSSLPLEDRLLTYVKNVGWEYTDAELRDELRKKNVTDDTLVGRLVEYANELREAA